MMTNIPVTLFKKHIPVFYNTTAEEVLCKMCKWIPKEHHSDLFEGVKGKDEQHSATTFLFGGYTFVVFWQKPTPGMIAHEAVHAANNVLHLVDVPITHQNDEVLAYLVEFIVDEIHKTVNKKKAVGSKKKSRYSSK